MFDLPEDIPPENGYSTAENDDEPLDLQ